MKPSYCGTLASAPTTTAVARAAAGRLRRAGSRGMATLGPARRFLPAICVIVAMRVRFIWSPLTSDEGGFLAIARAWDRGASLYDDVWVDRPQGLILLYRVCHAIGLGTPEGVRLLAVVIW